mmetsp:Transcript_21788/g.20919  ORF Transcript_21788/g.20919 Transcript_21788/m.20919 type:complete len:119 (+) Transcript_21788:536-892(+)
MKECLEQRELEECNFAPTLSAKKKRGEDPRKLDQFLEDQSKYDELKRQKAQERIMETEKAMISQTVKPTYVNQKSVQILDRKTSRMNSEHRQDYNPEGKQRNSIQDKSRRMSSTSKNS